MDLRNAIEWLELEIARVPYGRVGISVQLHNGVVTKIFRTLEDSVAVQSASGGHAHVSAD